MNVIVDAQQFHAALNKVAKVIEKEALPILECVLVESMGGKCRLTGTNLEQYLTVDIPAEGMAGSFAMERPKDILKSSKFFTGELRLEYSEGGKAVCMVCGRKSSAMPARSADDYPTLPQAEQNQHIYKTNAGTLAERYDRVKYAACAPERKKPGYEGIFFMDTRVGAVDGYRLAVNTDPTLRVEKPFALPSKAMKLLPLFGGVDITLEDGEKWAILRAESICLYTRQLVGDGFSFSNAIPEHFSEEYTADVRQFSEELQYLTSVVKSSVQPIVQFSGDKLSVANADATYQSDIDIVGDAKIDYGFDGRYMLDGLGQFKKKGIVKISVISPMSPIVLTDGGDNLALVLPFRVRNAA